MKRFPLFLTFLIAILLTTVASEAVVIIYKGTGSMVRGDGTVARTVPTTLFFILDATTFEGRWIFAQSIAGAKTIFDDGSRQYGLCNPPPGGVKTTGSASAYYATATFNSTGVTTFDCFSVRMGGKKASVEIIAAIEPVSIAKIMTGSYSFINGLKVVDGKVSVSVDLKRSQFSNGNGLTVTQAAAVIINDYTAPPKNYTIATPNP